MMLDWAEHLGVCRTTLLSPISSHHLRQMPLLVWLYLPGSTVSARGSHSIVKMLRCVAQNSVKTILVQSSDLQRKLVTTLPKAETLLWGKDVRMR